MTINQYAEQACLRVERKVLWIGLIGTFVYALFGAQAVEWADRLMKRIVNREEIKFREFLKTRKIK